MPADPRISCGGAPRTKTRRLTPSNTLSENSISQKPEMSISNWSFTNQDRSVVRNRIKKYKKSTNKKTVGYYDAKKRKKK